MKAPRICRSAMVLTALLCTQAVDVHASPLLELVGDTGSPGGLQPRAYAGGSAATYFNPALLTQAPSEVTLGAFVLNQSIGVLVDGRPGTEFAVPDGIANARSGEGERFETYPIPTDLLQYGREESAAKGAFEPHPRQAAGSGHETLTYVVVGAVLKMLEGDLALGFHGMIPMGSLTRMRAIYNDEREQYFSNSIHPELYGDRMLALSIAMAAGFNITDDLSVGAGATLALSAGVNAGAYVSDPSNLGDLLLDIDAPVEVGVSPHFGVRYHVADFLELTASLHAPQQLKLDANFAFLLPTPVAEQSGLKFVLDYMPWRGSVGGTFWIVQEEKTDLAFVSTVFYNRWSDYVDRHGEKPSPAYAWADTLSPSGGVRFRTGALSLQGDVTYTPTPIPMQSGRTNYVDNDRVSSLLGMEYKLEAMSTTFKLGLQMQVHHLLSRYQRKLPTPTYPDGTVASTEIVLDELPDDSLLSGEPVEGAQGLQTNNPGWPGFASGGWILGAGIYVSAEL